jgi:peroxiredoxin Q/BCP
MRALTALLALGLTSTAAAQGPHYLEVGAPAPDFSLTGATREGVLPKPVRLADFKGQTVVLAFFYKARSSG